MPAAAVGYHFLQGKKAGLEKTRNAHYGLGDRRGSRCRIDYLIFQKLRYGKIAKNTNCLREENTVFIIDTFE